MPASRLHWRRPTVVVHHPARIVRRYRLDVPCMATRALLRGAVDLLPDVERGAVHRARRRRGPRRVRARCSPTARSATTSCIIVDDKSTDRTPEIADALAAADRHVRVIHHEVNRKLGGSIKTGLRHRHAATSCCTPTPTCRSTSRRCRGRSACCATTTSTWCSAYRFDRTGEGYTRAIYTFFYNLLIRRMFGVKARDINFAFKLLSRRVVRRRRAAQRGLVHRRRADHPGDPFGVRAAPVRCRLLPAHPG